jgi:hypothetical protein
MYANQFLLIRVLSLRPLPFQQQMQKYLLTFDVLAEVKMCALVFWVVITGALAGGHQHFGEAWAYYYPNFSPEA